MKHDQNYFTKLQIANFIERGFDIIVRQNDDHKEVGYSRIYYGMTHEVSVWPSVRYFHDGLMLDHLGTDATIRVSDCGRNDSTILQCNKKSRQTLTIGNLTIKLCNYTRDQVLDLFRKKGIKIEDPSVKV